MSASTDRLLRYLGLSSIFFCVFQRLVEVSPYESRGIICGQCPVNAGVVIRFLWIIQRCRLSQGFFKVAFFIQKVEFADAAVFAKVLRHPIISTYILWIQRDRFSSIRFSHFKPGSLFIVARCMVLGHFEITSGELDEYLCLFFVAVFAVVGDLP